MPSGRNYEAKGIDWSKPVRTVPVTAKGKCPSCKQESNARLNFKGNVGATVSGEFYAQCGNKKCDKKPMIKLTAKKVIN